MPGSAFRPPSPRTPTSAGCADRPAIYPGRPPRTAGPPLARAGRRKRQAGPPVRVGCLSRAPSCPRAGSARATTMPRRAGAGCASRARWRSCGPDSPAVRAGNRNAHRLMTCWARRRGGKPRRPATPCSVMTTWTSCSVWPAWLTMAVMQEIAPPLTADGVRNMRCGTSTSSSRRTRLSWTRRGDRMTSAPRSSSGCSAPRPIAGPGVKAPWPGNEPQHDDGTAMAMAGDDRCAARCVSLTSPPPGERPGTGAGRGDRATNPRTQAHAPGAERNDHR